jgi:hypothetical protein
MFFWGKRQIGGSNNNEEHNGQGLDLCPDMGLQVHRSICQMNVQDSVDVIIWYHVLGMEG